MTISSHIIGKLGIGDMMGMRVSFDIDYSSLHRNGDPDRRFRVPLSRARERGYRRVDQVLRAPVVAAGGMPRRVQAP